MIEPQTKWSQKQVNQSIEIGFQKKDSYNETGPN